MTDRTPVDPHHDLIERANDELRQRSERALNLLQVIADPECDPNDFAADGITVFQVIQRDAQETLALFARNQTDGDEEVIHKVQLLPGEVLRAFLASTAVSEPKGAET
jgi:hypothetical protein